MTRVWIKGESLWLQGTPCNQVTWTKEPPPRPNDGWPGVQYSVGVWGRYPDFPGWGEAYVGGANVFAPYSVTSGGYPGSCWIRITSANGGWVNIYFGYWPRVPTRVVATPLTPEPPPTGCLVKVLVSGNQRWSRSYSVPCSEIPVDKKCEDECPPGWRKIVLNANSGKFCCCPPCKCRK